MAAVDRLRWELMAYVRHHWGAWRARRIDFAGKGLNAGCGKRPLPGWINADIRPGTEVVFDFRRRWPIRDAQLKCVRLEHVLEHMSYPDQALHVLSEASRVLRAGGEIRVGVPATATLLYILPNNPAINGLRVGMQGVGVVLPANSLVLSTFQALAAR